MGCLTFKEALGRAHDAKTAHATLSTDGTRPLAFASELALPTSLSPKTPARKASSAFLENPHRRWQRRQMGEELFESARRAPEASSKATTDLRKSNHPIDMIRNAQCHGSSIHCFTLHVRKKLIMSSGEHPSPATLDTLCDTCHIPYGCDRESQRECACVPPGTALPYAPEPFPQSSPVASSSYSEPPATPSEVYRRSHSYRSYSGRAMYSPANFPLSSSPYGTPTIRMVQKSALDVGDRTNCTAQDDGAKTQVVDTTTTVDSLGALGAQSKM